MTHLAPFTTQRLVLTRPEEHDVENLHRLLSDPDVWEHYPSLRPHDVAATRAWLEQQQAQWDRDGVGTWVARLWGDGGAAAFVGYGGIDRRGPVWNLGFRVARACWGRGYAKEIATAALAVAE